MPLPPGGTAAETCLER